MFSVKLQSTQQIIASRVILAQSLAMRCVGLLNRSGLETDEGLWLQPCSAIHTVGMRFNIDAVFLDSENKIIAFIEDMPPLRLSPFVAKARAVLELKSGRIKQCNLKSGDTLIFSESNP